MFKNNGIVENVELNGRTYVGGLGGLLYSNAVSNSNLKNIKIRSKGNYAGGIVGYSVYSVTDSSLYGVNIVISNPTSYIGGIAGFSGGIKNINIEGHTENGTQYNIINAQYSSHVGGINGYIAGGTLEQASIKNISITGQYNVGGLDGYSVCTTIRNSYSQNCSVSGISKVGGILGQALTDNTQRVNGTQIYNTYTDAIIIAQGDMAGGLIGELDNSKTNNQTYRYFIYNNYIATSTITANTNAGGLIGGARKPIYYLNDNAKYIYGNLVVSNIDSNHPIGNIDDLYDVYTIIVDEETGEEKTIKEKVEPEETIRRLFNSLFYQYNIENGKKVISKAELDTLKTKSTYKEKLLFNADKYNYSSSIIDTKYPILTDFKDATVTYTDGTTKTFTQTGILLPEASTTTKMSQSLRQSISLSLYANNNLPQYNVYVSDVNKINIEFSDINKNVYFKYEYGDEISEKIPIEQRVYTLEYDFKEPINIILGNSKGEAQQQLSPNDISKKVSIVNNNYYYLVNNTLKERQNIILGQYLNIFENKVLTIDGYIYDVITNSTSKTKTEGIRMLKTVNNIAESTYLGNIIETYYNFTKVISETDENIVPYQTFVKDGKLFIIDGSLDIYGDSIIIESYNNKEYQTVLGKDGILYDLKDKIKYPEDFNNSEIIQITNNIHFDKPEILILYKNGRVYAFNYITGSILFDTNTEKSEVLSNGTRIFSSAKKENVTLYKPEEKDYKEAILLKEKLTDTPIEQAEIELSNRNISVDNKNIINGENDLKNVQNNIINNNNSINNSNNNAENSNTVSDNNSYVTVYDSKSNRYLVYKTSSILNNEKSDKEDKIISETEKINLTPALKEFYQTAKGNKDLSNNSGIILIIITIFTVCIILIVMYKKKNYA